MIKKAATHIKLGIFITVGFILFAVAIYVIGMNQQLFSKTFRISGTFTDVSGLQAATMSGFRALTWALSDASQLKLTARFALTCRSAMTCAVSSRRTLRP